MKKDSFPDWVLKAQRPSTSIKKIGNSYYLYYASSIYDPVHKKPKAIQSYIGKITKDGIVSDRIMIDPLNCEVFKLGELMSDIDEDLKDLYVLKAKRSFYLLKCDEKLMDKLNKKGLLDHGKILL